jgi:hypothetical protein
MINFKYDSSYGRQYQGVFLEENYENPEDEQNLTYIQSWGNSLQKEKGIIKFHPIIDSGNFGKIFFELWLQGILYKSRTFVKKA